MGNLLAVAVHAANIHNTKSAFWQREMPLRNIHPLNASALMRNTARPLNFEQDVSRDLGLGADISVRIKPEQEILPKRWIVERSLAWFNNSRRLPKDYEISLRSAQTVHLMAAFRTLQKGF